jgi:hypothetical protein
VNPFFEPIQALSGFKVLRQQVVLLQVETHGLRQPQECDQFLLESVFVGRFLSEDNFDELVVLV